MARATTAKRPSAPKKKAPAAKKATAVKKAAAVKKAPASKTAATAKKAGASKRRGWTKDDVKELKGLAKQKLPTAKIAKALKRTEGATRQKAYSLGVSLDSRR
ncbi:MAG: hypothetical protein HXX10_11430 [Rhodoplanes sp.]|uniref:hypothetical protein n=1 Tax=Rhodoplanes sp. TaxID=1968906 RepID=UPI0017992D8B|nr:hypothetical protein [Rhodoplanes sp.]NVO14638.1 hypothetical protein [Rhodoplanes sp.]